MKNINIFLAPSIEAVGNSTFQFTVEAEYGATVVEGTKGTLAHHQKSGKYSTENPAPCNDPKAGLWAGWVDDGDQFLISHIDLDTIGGLGKILGVFNPDTHRGFWTLAEFVDNHGPHALDMDLHSAQEEAQLYAYWAKAQEPRTKPTQIAWEATEVVKKHFVLLTEILLEGKHLEAGVAFKEKGQKAEKESWYGDITHSKVGVRVTDDKVGFVSHLYNHEGKVYEGLAVLNKTTGAVTISLAKETSGVNCCEIVQRLWGKDAGGKAGIAGSPRGRVMNFGDLKAAADALQAALQG